MERPLDRHAFQRATHMIPQGTVEGKALLRLTRHRPTPSPTGSRTCMTHRFYSGGIGDPVRHCAKAQTREGEPDLGHTRMSARSPTWVAMSPVRPSR